MCTQSSCVVQLTTDAAFDFPEASLFRVFVHLTVVALVLIDSFASASLATIQTFCVLRRAFSRGLRHVFFRSVIIAHSWARPQNSRSVRRVASLLQNLLRSLNGTHGESPGQSLWQRTSEHAVWNGASFIPDGLLN